MNLNARLRAAVVLLIALSICLSGRLAAQSRQTTPPEYRELVAAYQLKDPALRLKEFQRILAAYPTTAYKEAIEATILESKVALAEALDDVLELQKDFLATGQGPARAQKPVVLAAQLLNHPRLETFDHSRVLDVALAYRAAALKAAADPASYEGIPEDQRAFFKSNILGTIELLTARAYLNTGDTDKAMASVQASKKIRRSDGGELLFRPGRHPREHGPGRGGRRRLSYGGRR